MSKSENKRNVVVNLIEYGENGNIVKQDKVLSIIEQTEMN